MSGEVTPFFGNKNSCMYWLKASRMSLTMRCVPNSVPENGKRRWEHLQGTPKSTSTTAGLSSGLRWSLRFKVVDLGNKLLALFKLYLNRRPEISDIGENDDT
jgi:hypothetical protein